MFEVLCGSRGDLVLLLLQTRLQGCRIIQENGVLEMHIQLTVEHWEKNVVIKTDKKV